MPAHLPEDIDIRDLEGLSRARLRERWREEFGEGPPAAFGRDLLAHGIAYAVQERQFGGLSKPQAREIDRLFDHAPIMARWEGRSLAAPVTRPGTVLVREWQGTAHQVTVLADGFAWNGQHHASLSGIAHAITGTKWNGPRFFGLREVDHDV